MGKKLVLIGGGHAHMVTLANISTLTAKGHRVTVVGSPNITITPALVPACRENLTAQRKSALPPGKWWKNRAGSSCSTQPTTLIRWVKSCDWPPETPWRTDLNWRMEVATKPI